MLQTVAHGLLLLHGTHHVHLWHTHAALLARWRVVHIVHIGLAGIIKDTGRWISSLQLLTLSHHRDNGTDRGGRNRVDRQIRFLENLREVLRHTLGNTMVLTLTSSCQVAQSVLSSLLHRVELSQHLIAQRRKLTGILGLAQRLYWHGIIVLLKQVAGTMATIVRQIVRLVALRGRSKSRAWQMIVVGHVTSSQELVGSNLFECCLS